MFTSDCVYKMLFAQMGVIIFTVLSKHGIKDKSHGFWFVMILYSKNNHLKKDRTDRIG